MILAAAFVTLFTTMFVYGLTVPVKRADICNGHAELCSRSYGNITFAGGRIFPNIAPNDTQMTNEIAHDSFASSTNPLDLAADQEVNITAQLNLGMRMLQAQSHMKDGVLHFCHTSCELFDGGTVEDYLNTVKSWMDSNPTEVVTLLFTNPEGADVQSVWDPIFKSAGMDQLAFVPPNSTNPIKQSEWPTLGDMIDSGKRLVVFLDANADTTRVPYILDEFSLVWETPFDSTDSSFPCSVDRIHGPLATEDHLSLINHFLDDALPFGITIPDKHDASTTNSVASITANAAGCAGFTAGRAPNFVLMDWVNIGEPIKAVDQLNGFSS